MWLIENGASLNRDADASQTIFGTRNLLPIVLYFTGSIRTRLHRDIQFENSCLSIGEIMMSPTGN